MTRRPLKSSRLAGVALLSGALVAGVTVRAAGVPKDNAAIEEIARGRANVAIADWASAVRAHPEQVQSDRIHPTIKGAHLFSKAVRQALADLSERNTGTPVVLKELPIP